MRWWLALVMAGCGGSTAARTTTVPAVVLGADAATHDVVAGLAAPIEGVSLAVAALPEAAGSSSGGDEHADAIARARRAYINADFPGCRAALDPIDTVALLDGHRTTAARVLVWRVACRVGENDRAGAKRDASLIAAAGLALPPDISSVTPDVEALIGDVVKQVGATKRSSFHVASKPSGGRVAVDGADDTCVAPCTLTLAPGPHEIAIVADGFTPVARRVQAPDDKQLAVELVEAAPPVIAGQLLLRVARGGAVDDVATLSLAARAIRARQVAVFAISNARLVGALYADGHVDARAERVLGHGATTEVTAELARELLGTGGVIPSTPLWRRPRFWISVGGAAVIAAGVTALVLVRPNPQTKVGFP